MFRRQARYEPGSLIVRCDRSLSLTAPIWERKWERLLRSYQPAVRQAHGVRNRLLDDMVVLDQRYLDSAVYFGLYIPGRGRDHAPDVAVSIHTEEEDAAVARCAPLEFAIGVFEQENWMLHYLGQGARLEVGTASLPFPPRNLRISSRQDADAFIRSPESTVTRLFGKECLVIPDAPERADPLRFSFSLAP